MPHSPKPPWAPPPGQQATLPDGRVLVGGAKTVTVLNPDGSTDVYDRTGPPQGNGSNGPGSLIGGTPSTKPGLPAPGPVPLPPPGPLPPGTVVPPGWGPPRRRRPPPPDFVPGTGEPIHGRNGRSYGQSATALRRIGTVPSDPATGPGSGTNPIRPPPRPIYDPLLDPFGDVIW